MKLTIKTPILLFLGAGLVSGLSISAVRGRNGHDGIPVRNPVLVRVFDDGRFVPDLRIEDFEIEECGLRVAPEGLLLIHKNEIERREGWNDIPPDVSRRFVLLLQLYEYHSKIPETLTLLINELLPGDTLEIQTPMRNFQLTEKALSLKSREAMARELTTIVKTDIVQGGMAYISALRNLQRLVRQIGGTGNMGLTDTTEDLNSGTSLEHQLMQYTEKLQRMETLRATDENKLLAFARTMKARSGQKHIFFIYQREFRPEISPESLSRLVMANQDRPDILAEAQNLFGTYSRPIVLDSEKLRTIFADSSSTFNFLFIKRQPEYFRGITMREQSEDVFKALSEVARATGGIIDSSQNPEKSIDSALKASEFFYVLYYTPSTSAPPGTFLDLEIRIKDKNYRVDHRTGYLAGQ